MANFFPSTAKNISCFPVGGPAISFVVELEIEIKRPSASFYGDLDVYKFFQSKHNFNYDNESENYFE